MRICASMVEAKYGTEEEDVTEDLYSALGVVLSDPVQRAVYDEIHGYSATATNPFFDDNLPKDHMSVDEFTCIGCKNCANVCPSVFKIEEGFGRSRVYSQSGSTDLRMLLIFGGIILAPEGINSSIYAVPEVVAEALNSIQADNQLKELRMIHLPPHVSAMQFWCAVG